MCVLPNSPPHIPQLLCVLDTIVPRICSACGRRHVCHRSFPRGVVVRPLGACPRWTMALGGLCAPTLPSYQQLLSYTLLVKEFALLASKRFSTFSGSSRVCAPFGRFIQRREGGDAKSHPRRAIARLRTTRLCLTRGEMEKGSSQLWLPTDFANLSTVASLGIILSRHILVAAPPPLQISTHSQCFAANVPKLSVYMGASLSTQLSICRTKTKRAAHLGFASLRDQAR